MAALKVGIMPEIMPTLAEKPRAKATAQAGAAISTMLGCRPRIGPVPFLSDWSSSMLG